MVEKETADNLSRTVGERLKVTRTERRLTIRDLAEASGLSPNTISLIERAEISPTVATMHKLATALDVPLASLLEVGGGRQVVFQKQGLRRRGRSGGVLLENLGAGLRDQTMESLLLTLEPGADSGRDPIVHAGHELVFCLEGRVEYEVDTTTYQLEPYDSLLFEAALPHRWRNATSALSRVLLVIQAAEGRDVARRRHGH